MTSNRVPSLEEIIPGVSRETSERLRRFEELFRQWSGSINLMSQSARADIWARHVLDSAQLFPLGGSARRWLDIGSGGGFPGIVLAFLLTEAPDAHLDLVESNGKKAAFLQTCVGRFALPAKVNVARVETFSPAVSPQVVTARAVASLASLLSMTERWITGETRALFPKGRDYRREVEDCAQTWRYDLVEHRSVTDSEAVILEISNLRRR